MRLYSEDDGLLYTFCCIGFHNEYCWGHAVHQALIPDPDAWEGVSDITPWYPRCCFPRLRAMLKAPIPHWMQLQIDRNHPQKSSNHVDVVPQLSDCEVDIRSQNASVIAREVEGARPETTPEPRLDVRRRRLEMARAEMGESPKCQKCEGLEAGHAEASANFFKEIEHLRRALGKLLEGATKYMPANVLRALKESLQLDVRYLTKPEEGEGGPLPPAPVVEVVDQSELIEKLRRQIAELEKEILDQKYTIQDREKELRKAQEALRAAGVQSVATPKARPKRQLPESKEIQTEPWAPFPAKQEVVKVVDPKSAVETEPGPPKVKKERPKAPVAVESDSDEPQVDAGKKSGKKVVAKREEVQVVSTGIDPDVVRRLQAELDLLKIKLASAERELGKMDGLKSEIERLKQQVSDKDKRIEELEEELKKLKAKKPPKAEVKEEVKKEVKPPPEKKEKKKEKKFKQDAPPTPKTPTQPTVAVKEEETPVEPVPVEEEPVEPPPEVSSEGAWGLIDEPIFIKGRGLQKQEGELNKTGRCYERYMVEQPTLGLTNTPSLSTIDVDATLARLKGSRGVGVYSNGAILGGVQCASTWAGSRSTGRLEAEPYLTQVLPHFAGVQDGKRPMNEQKRFCHYHISGGKASFGDAVMRDAVVPPYLLDLSCDHCLCGRQIGSFHAAEGNPFDGLKDTGRKVTVDRFLPPVKPQDGFLDLRR
eukprot:g26313.t1